MLDRAMRVSTTTRIARPPEHVFDTLADLRNETQWNSRVSSAELRSAEPIGPGSRFAIVNGGTPYDDRETRARDRKSTRLNSSHTVISYAVFCLKKKKKQQR